MNLSEIKNEEQKRVDQLMKDCKVFFAFSHDQFEKGKTKLRENEKYISLGAGGYMPEGYFLKFREGMDEIKLWKGLEIKKGKLEEAEILDAFENFECFYTGDLVDTFELFEGIYSKEYIRNVYLKNLKNK
jgi:hypothetical protein